MCCYGGGKKDVRLFLYIFIYEWMNGWMTIIDILPFCCCCFALSWKWNISMEKCIYSEYMEREKYLWYHTWHVCEQVFVCFLVYRDRTNYTGVNTCTLFFFSLPVNWYDTWRDKYIYSVYICVSFENTSLFVGGNKQASKQATDINSLMVA